MKRKSSEEIKHFEVLVKQNMKRAYFSAFGILGSHDAAMELSQQAFIRAYRNFNKFDVTKNFFTWYYKILRNLCFNYIRDSNRNRMENIFDLEDVSVDPIYQFEQNELKELLSNSFLQLKAEDREILVLKEFENLSYKEIADALNIPIGSVMSRLYNARKKLAEIMKRKM